MLNYMCCELVICVPFLLIHRVGIYVDEWYYVKRIGWMLYNLTHDRLPKHCFADKLHYTCDIGAYYK
ncbi:hypothetical protein VNO77_35912 [Canavalia gladiata]|uniref:Uncharacterized protein n=1 Tax=Canavalia gladiata TaxID=3824 RepID=A0AAN9K8X9_CANGL